MKWGLNLDNQRIIIIAIIVIFALLIGKIIEDKKQMNKIKKAQEEMQKRLYPNQNYNCKGYEHYIMSDKEKINYIFDGLQAEDKQKLIRYGENLYKAKEAQKYSRK